MRWGRLVLILFGLLLGGAPGSASAQERERLLFLGNEQIPPMLFRDGRDGSGIVHQLFDEISALVGEYDLVLELDDWQKAQTRVRNGRAEGLVQLNQNPERQEFLLFSDPLLRSEFVIFHHADRWDIRSLDDLYGGRVAVEAAGFPISILRRHAQIQPMIVDSWRQGFEAVQTGQADALVVDKWVGEYVLAEAGLRDIRVVPEPVAVLDSHIAVIKDRPEVIEAINGALRVMHSNGRFDAILDEWRGSEVLYITTREARLQEYVFYSLVATLVLALGLGVQTFRVVRQRRQLADHNKNLEAAVERGARKYARQRDRLTDILAATRAGTWEWHIPDGEVEFNPRWATMIGRQLSDISPATVETWFSYMHPEDQILFKRLFDRHVSGELEYFEVEVRLRDVAGHWVWVMNRGRVVEWSGEGKPIRMSGTQLEISRRKRAEAQLASSRRELEEQLAQSEADNLKITDQAAELAEAVRREATLRREAEAGERAKAEFLASVSHEVRTPLTAVMGMTELLSRKPDRQPEEIDQINHIKQASAQLMALINDLLDISKIDGGHLGLEWVPGDVPALVAQVTGSFDAVSRDKGLELSLIVEETVPELVYCDPLRLRQVLFNLVGNAVKFTTEGSVTVKVGCTDGSLWFEISDTGIGIEKHKMADLFRKFVQADATISRRFAGTGLGLAISRRLVELMGGAISVDSVYGKGSTFQFTLPCKPANASIIAFPAKDVRDEERVSPLHILIAEDIEVNRILVAAFLDQRGYRYHFALNGREAVECVQKQDFDLVLMDIRMPEMDGIQALKEIRALEGPVSQIPIIAFTADAMPESIEEYDKTGFVSVVTKPVDAQDLFGRIEEAAG